ncbi:MULTISPECIES: FAD-dependent monooxygenase [unclassified Rhizobacter]|uniref:FAD-dependent monooxygenase n=1 Tax=unclassified Rhizobacter TaxID=2640088 RepID=UPI0007006F7C|nr:MULTISPECIES: FAD-dependent monooxygenase [unclassified Rhizobacter]KQU81643.1 FAD-dependent oxidoreductase [Rhizobacter sp. Root29]KQW12028.1 FAD-dependent oxidoreductase [Rhizobacter sp. Root1238]KRB13400.1 FAD-dependent oxidoreductase [Rhizobacter sp. Root16D2]
MSFPSSSHLHDVVIAGAGPVGLFLACELALAKLDVLVLERADRPEAPLKAPPLGTRGLSVATAEALYRRGLLDPLVAAASTPRKAQAGHFAGIAIDPAKIDPTRWKYRLPNPASANFAADMSSVESVLAARAVPLGVAIRRGHTVTGLDDHGDAVTVHAGGHAFHAKWLVGCDGGRSAVRQLAGFEFPGTEPEFTAYSALVEMADPGKLPPGRHATPAGFYMNEPGRIAIADFDGGAFDRSQAITPEHLQAVLRRVSGTDVTLSAVHLATSFTDRARLATTYRQGRVLLAGDAAHIHSALGGQGLNAGLGDAMNLGWKLAATVHGNAPAGLLDTYHAERHPVGEWLLDWTRAQAAVMRPDAHGRALEGIVRALVDTPDGATWFAEQLWGLSLRYDLGGSHPLVGHSAPDFELPDGSRLASHLSTGAGVLVDCDASSPLRHAIAPWHDRIRHVTCGASNALGLAALLVRPDGFVAWASDKAAVASEVEAAALRWFGRPSHAISSDRRR